jgi:hypothetical protein
MSLTPGPEQLPSEEGARAPERRVPGARRSGRRGVGRRRDEQAKAAERRELKGPEERRQQRTAVIRWIEQNRVEPFLLLLVRLARAIFGPDATVVPHLRWSRGRRYLVFVVDAAHPEAGLRYDEFLPLEQAFWGTYARLPKPNASFMVAVRPSRGWCRSEALAPMFALFQLPEEVT